MLRSGGLPEAAFSLGVNRVVQICISEPVLAEYQEVLGVRGLAYLRKRRPLRLCKFAR